MLNIQDQAKIQHFMRKTWLEGFVWISSKTAPNNIEDCSSKIVETEDELKRALQGDVNRLLINKEILDQPLVQELKANRIEIYAYLVEEESELYKLIYWGVDGVITPNLETLKKRAEEALEEVDPKTIHEWMEKDEVFLVDVRAADEYEKEHLKNATLMPYKIFNPKYISAPENKKLVFCCQMGGRSHFAARHFLAAASPRPCYNLKGGINAWKKENLPLITE